MFEKTIEVLPEYEDLFRSKALCKILVGSMWSGKSHYIAEEALRLITSNKNTKVFVVFPSNDEREVWMKHHFGEIVPKEYISNFNTGGRCYSFKNGSKLYTATPANNNLKGIVPDAILFDEFSLINEGFIKEFMHEVYVNENTKYIFATRAGSVFVCNEKGEKDLSLLSKLILCRSFFNRTFRTSEWFYKVCDAYESSVYPNETLRILERSAQ